MTKQNYTLKQFDDDKERKCKTIKCIEKAHIKFYCGGMKGLNRKGCIKSAIRKVRSQEW